VKEAAAAGQQKQGRPVRTTRCAAPRCDIDKVTETHATADDGTFHRCSWSTPIQWQRSMEAALALLRSGEEPTL
jgi:hypothetical protein